MIIFLIERALPIWLHQKRYHTEMYQIKCILELFKQITLAIKAACKTTPTETDHPRRKNFPQHTPKCREIHFS